MTHLQVLYQTNGYHLVFVMNWSGFFNGQSSSEDLAHGLIIWNPNLKSRVFKWWYSVPRCFLIEFEMFFFSGLFGHVQEDVGFEAGIRWRGTPSNPPKDILKNETVKMFLLRSLILFTSCFKFWETARLFKKKYFVRFFRLALNLVWIIPKRYMLATQKNVWKRK